jgi:hypothetical protein
MAGHPELKQGPPRIVLANSTVDDIVKTTATVEDGIYLYDNIHVCMYYI